MIVGVLNTCIVIIIHKNHKQRYTCVCVRLPHILYLYISTRIWTEYILFIIKSKEMQSHTGPIPVQQFLLHMCECYVIINMLWIRSKMAVMLACLCFCCYCCCCCKLYEAIVCGGCLRFFYRVYCQKCHIIWHNLLYRSTNDEWTHSA